METKIDQDSFLSSQLTLWNQRGSNVIRGNVIAIPIDETMLYVEPIYLQSDTAAYPELRLVAVMHNDRLSYAETFQEALQGLFEDGTAEGAQTSEDLLSRFSSQQEAAGPDGDGGAAGAQAAGGKTQAAGIAPAQPLPEKMNGLIRSASDAFDTYFELLGEKRFGEASRELERLGRVLEEMGRQQSGQQSGRE